MAELNDKGREIWFSRTRWRLGYTPTHWKGVLCWCLIIALMVLPSVLVELNNPGSNLTLVIFVLGSAFSLWIAERHSPSPR